MTAPNAWDAWWALLSNLQWVNKWANILGIACTVGLAISYPLAWWTGAKIAGRMEAQLQTAQTRLEPRSLTANQHASLLTALQQGPRGTVVVETVPDPESVAFASELAAVLREAGWPTTTGGQVFGISPEGIFIAVGDPDNPPAHAVLFRSALEGVGIKVQGAKEGGLPASSLVLLVGHKPKQ